MSRKNFEKLSNHIKRITTFNDKEHRRLIDQMPCESLCQLEYSLKIPFFKICRSIKDFLEAYPSPSYVGIDIYVGFYSLISGIIYILSVPFLILFHISRSLFRLCERIVNYFSSPFNLSLFMFQGIFGHNDTTNAIGRIARDHVEREVGVEKDNFFFNMVIIISYFFYGIFSCMKGILDISSILIKLPVRAVISFFRQGTLFAENLPKMRRLVNKANNITDLSLKTEEILKIHINYIKSIDKMGCTPINRGEENRLYELVISDNPTPHQNLANNIIDIANNIIGIFNENHNGNADNTNHSNYINYYLNHQN